MASVRRKPGTRFWVACYTDAEGQQRQRSTKLVNRAKAQTVADGFEAIYRKKQTESQVRRSMAAIFEEVSGESLCHVTLAQWFATWLERIAPEVEPNTFAKYRDMTTAVKKFAPDLCAKLLDRIEPKHVLELRGELVANRSRGTTNLYLKIFRQSLQVAWMDGLMPDNPAARVPYVKATAREEGEGKRPFTLEEVRALLKIAGPEWRGLIFAGLYTAGQRLSDVVTLQASQVDLAQRTVRFSTDKTGREVIVPIVDAWMRELRPRVEAGGFLYPAAAKRFHAAGGKVGPISNAFRRLLARMGLATKSNRKREGAVAGRRKVNPLSYHSFRHTATSMLKNAGVSDAVARDIVGHESEAVSANYTHIEEATKRAAMEKLPDITA